MKFSISANLKGGLGNMLFQITNAYTFALENDLNLVFNYRHRLIKRYNNNILRKIRFQNILESTFKTVKSAPTNINSNLNFEGYFQSMKYFRGFDVKKVYSISKSNYNYICDKYKKYFTKDTTSLHVRRGDYIKKSHKFKNLDKKYYCNALNYINKSDYILVFSDDINWCKKNLDIDERFIFIEGEKDYIDLYMMSMCNNNIIANSSFSWWGAYLNEHKNKIVVAPNQWFNISRKIDDNLYPNEWIKI